PAVPQPGDNAARGVPFSIGDRSITRAGLTQLTRVTGDPGVAFSAAYARAVLAGLVQVDQVDVLAAERAIIASHFRGSRTAYRRELARSRATEALAREVIADEVRQQRMGRRFRVGAPTAEEITSYYE